MDSILSIFSCIQVDSEVVLDAYSASYVRNRVFIGRYWAQDMAVQCYTGSHLALALAFGLPCLLIWALGIPLGFALLLRQAKARGKVLGTRPGRLPTPGMLGFAARAGFLFKVGVG